MNAVPRPPRRLLSVDDYRLMAEAGVFAPDERVELIEGEIITMAPIGPEHADIVSLLTESLVLAAHGSARVWVQSSVRVSIVRRRNPISVCSRAGPPATAARCRRPRTCCC